MRPTRVGGFVACARMQGLFKRLQLGQSLLRASVTFVCNVVRGARKAINCPHSATQMRRT